MVVQVRFQLCTPHSWRTDRSGLFVLVSNNSYTRQFVSSVYTFCTKAFAADLIQDNSLACTKHKKSNTKDYSVRCEGQVQPMLRLLSWVNLSLTKHCVLRMLRAIVPQDWDPCAVVTRTFPATYMGLRSNCYFHKRASWLWSQPPMDCMNTISQCRVVRCCAAQISQFSKIVSYALWTPRMFGRAFWEQRRCSPVLTPWHPETGDEVSPEAYLSSCKTTESCTRLSNFTTKRFMCASTVLFGNQLCHNCLAFFFFVDICFHVDTYTWLKQENRNRVLCFLSMQVQNDKDCKKFEPKPHRP